MKYLSFNIIKAANQNGFDVKHTRLQFCTAFDQDKIGFQ